MRLCSCGKPTRYQSGRCRSCAAKFNWKPNLNHNSDKPLSWYEEAIKNSPWQYAKGWKKEALNASLVK